MAIKVLIIDDSALIRRMLSEMLNAAPGIEVVGTAQDPIVARERIKQLKPDVLTLDVEMPRMDGITFLEKLMRLHPMPVVMVSSLTEKGAETTLRALELGAVDFVEKPKVDLSHTFAESAEEIIQKIRIAAGARVQVQDHSVVPREVPEKFSADAILSGSPSKRHFKTTDQLIAVGASTGGTEAIRQFLEGLPADAPGVVIAQHIPAAFSGPFAARMNNHTAMTVFEAQEGQHILPGHVYIAPGSHHLLVRRDGARFVCTLSDGPPVNRHRPSVDVLFRSVALNIGPNAIGVIMTGMGDDGAEGLREMHEAGAFTVAQDEHSSVVWGMPKEAVRRGAVDETLPLAKIARRVLEVARQHHKRHRSETV